MKRLSSISRFNRCGHWRPRLTSALLFLFAMALFFLLRYDSPYFISNSLWAEDGPVFINSGIAHPWASITAPYSGYLHLYPRLISAAASIIPVAYFPTLLFGGWVAAMMFLWHVVTKLLDHCAAPLIAAAAVFLACLLQPHTGETFLSLTNAQWWLAGALALMACFPQRFNKLYAAPTLLLSLTGPFSILFLLPGWFQAIRSKRYTVVLPLTVGAAIQAFQLFNNGRAQQVLDPDIGHWLYSVSTVLLWGNKSVIAGIAAGLFWMIAITVALRGTWRYRSLILCGVLAYVSALYAMKGMPAALSPLGNGARYFVLPYSLIILATFLNPALRRWQGCIAALSLLTIFFSVPLKVNQASTFYKAYAKLAAYENSLSIPIAPYIQNSPGFTLTVFNSAPLSLGPGIPLHNAEEGGYQVASEACAGVRAAGFVVETNFQSAGYSTLQWKDWNDTEYSSERRFYQAGPQRMQFAFIKNKKPVTVQFQPPAGTHASQLGKSYFLCLP